MKEKIKNLKEKIKPLFKTFGIYYLALCFMEICYGLLIFDSYLKTTIFNVFIYLIPIAFMITILTSVFKEKINKVIACVIFGILGFWFSLQFVFKTVYGCFFSFDLFQLTDQVMQFGKETIFAILRNFYGIVLFFGPFILFFVFKKKLSLPHRKIKGHIIYLVSFVLGFCLFFLNINMQPAETYSSKALYFDINDNSLNIEKLGVIDAGILDITRTVFGFEEKMLIVQKEEPKDNPEDIFEYDYNNENIDFGSLTSSNSEIKQINNYMANSTGTKQNKYTGLFEGKNLIYITAESFSEIGVSEELTPTLYKLINTGFVFENFYTSNNCSTIGGEFQSLTGLYANYNILSTFRSGNVYFPDGLSTIFENNGYNTYAYHDHSYTFQNRNKYLASMGFDNFKGCGNGMEKLINCKQWPESDVEMMDATVSDYINGDKPFLAYYMTVSGHFEYDWYNKMAKKHKDAVQDLSYSDKVKAYIATQIELDQALETLIKKLDEDGKLDDTVFVMMADHYPYGLTIDEINEVSNYKRDNVVEINSNNLIIWNSKVKTTPVTKTAMSIDVIPTIYNLFGLEYDSRLYMGKDIFSSEPGLAIFKNRSWVTDKGTYFAANGKVINTDGEMSQEYINNINAEVSNRMNISKLIIKNNYYKYVYEK